MHTLEVLKAATQNSAKALRIEDETGLVRPGYEADLLIVDGSPLHNLRFMYSFGAVTLDENDEMYRTEGIIHTIKDGVVVNNDKLMEEVGRMVKESKEGVESNIANDPFLIEE